MLAVLRPWRWAGGRQVPVRTTLFVKSGMSATETDDGVALLDEDGEVLAVVGDTVEIGGDGDGTRSGCAPGEGGVWLVSSVHVCPAGDCENL